jgi:hypothetical protein
MDKKTGYLLILLGVCILLGSVWAMAGALYGRLPLPQPMHGEPTITISLSNGGTAALPLPPQLNQAGNMGFFFMALFFIAGVGMKLGRLGVALVKKDAPEKKEEPKA